MSIAIASRIRNEMCYIQICIDSYDDGEISGRLFNAYFRDAIFFDNSMEMLRKLDNIFDTFGYPHATMNLRSFETDGEEEKPVPRVKSAPMVSPIKHNARGKLATLRTRIMFRQNASWQGYTKWMEEELEEPFASCLELIMLINSIFDED